MNQFVPDVTAADVERILQRDFPADAHEELREMIRNIECWEKDRVVVASMKNAAGDVAKLKGDLHNAAGYWREIIADAEYPLYTKKMFRIDKLTEEEQAKIIEKDKTQYLAWFKR